MRKSVKIYIGYITILFGLSALMAIYVVQMTGVRGNSMEPELGDGQKVMVNKLLYQLDEPKRFDVIVFRYLYKNDEYYLKRIIGMPGETVQIKEGLVYINGEKLKDPFAHERIEKPKRAQEPIVLGEEEYFVLGDNRNFSSDSRTTDVGDVKRAQILGKAFLKLWPIEPIRHGE